MRGDRLEVFGDLIKREHQSGQIRHLPNELRVIANVIRYTQNIKRPLPVKIHQFANA
jgi:hypothetical protein